jgi:hypothetical protein
MKLFYIIFLVAVVFSQCGSKDNSYSDAPTPVSDTANYAKRIADIKDSIKVFIATRQGPYYSKEFDERTEIFIDTLLLSPRKDKMVFLVITKYSNNKLLEKSDTNQYHFDASCFIGKLLNNERWDIAWLRALNVTRYKSLQEASERIREFYFIEFKTIEEDESKKSLYKYNISEKQFWDGPVWEKYFE